MTRLFNINYVIVINFILVIILIQSTIVNIKEYFAFQAPYFRSQMYQNVCEPKYGGLLRVKKELQDDCVRKIEGLPKQRIKCYYDQFMNQYCKYI